MKSISLVQTADRNFNQSQQNTLQALAPILGNPIVTGNFVKKVTLQIGSNTISHGLARALQGWGIVRKRGPAGIYDSQDSNPSPSLTLILISDAVVSVDIYCF